MNRKQQHKNLNARRKKFLKLQKSGMTLAAIGKQEQPPISRQRVFVIIGTVYHV